MARQPNRTPQEKMEDDFMDLSIVEQTQALVTFQTLHRMKIRLQDQSKPVVQSTVGKTENQKIEEGYCSDGRHVSWPKIDRLGSCSFCERPLLDHLQGSRRHKYGPCGGDGALRCIYCGVELASWSDPQATEFCNGLQGSQIDGAASETGGKP